MYDIIVTLAILVIAVAIFVWNRVSVGLVAIGVSIALFVTGVLSFEQAVAGFGDPVIVFIAALFVVSEGLDATGVTTWVGQQLAARAGASTARGLLLVLLLAAVLSALISVNGAVAALLPMVVVLAIRLGQQPSQLLIPLAFGAHAGSLLVLTGSPVNVLIADAIADTGAAPITFFQFALVGVPALAGTVLLIVLLGPRLLPNRTPTSATRDLSNHAHTLATAYAIDEDHGGFSSERGLTEVIVPPRSASIGNDVFPGMVTAGGDLIIVAIQRSGENLGHATLQAGDVMVLRGTWRALQAKSRNPNVLVVDSPSDIHRQVVPMGPQARVALVIVAAMIVMLATGIVPPAMAALIAAAAMVLFRVLTPTEAQRSISWTTLILVGGMIPLSTAISTSGVADLAASGLVAVLGTAGPYAVLFGVALVTVILGQLISNTATALVLAPIALAIALELQISPVPLLMGIAVAAAASFLTPVATPANTMILEPGGYRFGDYWRLGLPLVALFVLIATFVVPVFWPF